GKPRDDRPEGSGGDRPRGPKGPRGGNADRRR
ncbi:MAG: 30S ribosomal protein S6, partial [Mesorhizobium sp.]